jgi:S-layer protein
VTQDAAATAAAAVVGKINGVVTIADAQAAHATNAGTIATVSLTSYANSTIDSGALTAINLSGTGGTLGVTAGALTTAVVNTMALGVNGATSGAVTLDADYTTLNLASSTAASTLANVTAAGVTTINVSGDAKVTLTDNTFGALTDVVVTNTAGAVFGTTALGNAVNFTGGAGDDSVSLGATTKAITMGDGNDTVTYGAAVGTGGSVDAGAGTDDTIVMSGAEADAADASAVFNTKYTNFEVLSVETGATETINLAGINAISKVTTIGANGLTLNNIASGATLTYTGASTAATVGISNATFNGADIANLILSNSTAGTVAYGTTTIADVETINITTTDVGTTTSTVATIDTATLTAAGATTINVSGNNGLTLTATGSTAVTTFDASGIVADAAEDTAALLAVTYSSLNATGSATVTITGGAGNDSLTGNAAKDTIVGGAGNDILGGAAAVDTITGGEGADVITGGSGNDNIILTETTAAIDKVVFSGGAATNALTLAANGVDTITGWGSTDLINVVALGDGTTGAATSAAITTAGVQAVLAGFDGSQVISTDGTAANLTTGGTLAVTDWTDMAQVSAYLSERFTHTTTTADLEQVFVINDTTAGQDKTYVINFDSLATANTTIDAAEISLVGVISNGGVDLTDANVVYA